MSVLPWLASWGALLLACVALVVVWLGVDRVRLRRDEHSPEQCAPGKEWP